MIKYVNKSIIVISFSNLNFLFGHTYYHILTYFSYFISLLLFNTFLYFSEGTRIRCVTGPRKKRKIVHKASFPLPTLTSFLDQPRGIPPVPTSLLKSPVMTATGTPIPKSFFVTRLEDAINSGEPERIKKYFAHHCHPNVILQVDLTATNFSSMNNNSPVEPVFREIRGINSIVSYFIAILQAIPDTIYLYWQMSHRHNVTPSGLALAPGLFPGNSPSPGEGYQVIDADCRIVGRRLYDIDVIIDDTAEDEAFHEEQRRLESAISGLTSLSRMTSEDVLKAFSVSTPLALPYEGQTTQSSSSSNSPASSGSVTPNPYNSSNVTSPFEDKVKSKSLDDMNILVASENVEFRIGKALKEPVNMYHNGHYSWVINSDNKVVKLKFVLSKIQ